MKNQYNHTVTACFIGYIVQAIVNNFAPLLFLTFQDSYHIPLSQITLLVTLNFGVQLLVDLVSITFVDKIGYRASMILAHLLSAGGLILLTVLPLSLIHIWSPGWTRASLRISGEAGLSARGSIVTESPS